MKYIAQLYSLSICFVSTIVTLIATIMLVVAIINVNFFDLRNESRLSSFNSNESYVSSLYNSYNNSDLEKIKALSSDKLENLRIQKKEEYISNEKSRINNNIIDCIIYIMVSLLFTLIHYVIYKKCAKAAALRENNNVKIN